MTSWKETLDAFDTACIDAGYAPETVRPRRARLNVLVQNVEFTPERMTPENVKIWIEQVNKGEGTPQYKKDRRIAIRAFCRWSDETGSLVSAAAPTPIRSRSGYTADQKWTDAAELYRAAMRGQRLADSTIQQRLNAVRKFAQNSQLGPWEITYEHFRGYLDEMAGTGLARSTVMQTRSCLRAFYLWARQTGRVFEDPAAEPSARASALPVPAAWAAELAPFRAHLRAIGRPESTINLYVKHLRRFARENASMTPWQVTLDDLLDWLSEKRWARETRRSYRTSLRAFYRWAELTKRIDMDPSAKMPAAPGGQPRPRPVLDAEYASAMAKADRREQLALRLAAELGLRRGEVVLVHSRDITGVEGEWSITVHGKGDKQRKIPLPANLATSLRALPEGFAFPGRFDGHLAPHRIGQLISSLLPKDVTMHALRHRFATRAYNVDRDVFTVQRLLGHASPATTQRYVQVADTAMRRLVDAVSA